MKLSSFGALVAALLVSSCATVQQNIDARTYLAQCRYEVESFTVTGVSFGSGLTIERIDTELAVKVSNPTKKTVALDHASVNLLLDGRTMLETAHPKFVQVAPGASAGARFVLALPVAQAAGALGHRPEVAGVRAKLWLTLLVGKDAWETPVVLPFDADVPIPYDQVQRFIDQRKNELAAEADRAAGAAAKAAAEEAAKRAADAAAQAKSLVPRLP